MSVPNSNKPLQNNSIIYPTNSQQTKRSLLNNSLLILRNASALNPIVNHSNSITKNDSLSKCRLSAISIKRSNKIENFLVEIYKAHVQSSEKMKFNEFVMALLEVYKIYEKKLKLIEKNQKEDESTNNKT